MESLSRMAMEELGIDDLSHENSLIRARNERLEAEKVDLTAQLSALVTILEFTGHASVCRTAKELINKHTGSAT